MKQTLTITTIITGFAVSAALFAVANSNRVDLMKEPSRSFALASELNPGESGLDSAPLVGKKSGDGLSADEYNRLLELLASTGSELPTGCNDGDKLVYNQSTSLWECGAVVVTPVDPLAGISDTCISTQVSADEIKTVCEYTGSDQTVRTPSGYTSATVKAWGAGGGSWFWSRSTNTWNGSRGEGGATGGYAQADISAQDMTVVVGQAGYGDSTGNTIANQDTYGFGSGCGGASSLGNCGSGGGLSGVFSGEASVAETDQGRALVIAGGGGGGGDGNNIDETVGGVGGGPSSGGAATMQGADSTVALHGGHGGGYTGGGTYQNRYSGWLANQPDTIVDGGEGGSNHVPSGGISLSSPMPDTNIPPQTSDLDYIAGVGEHSNTNDGRAGNGLVVIRWKKTATMSLPHTCLDVSQTQIVDRVSAQTGAIWMDRNLGAARAATSLDDPFAYGCLYSWGRGEDGHEKIQWTNTNSGTAVNGVTSTKFSSDTPGSSLFVEVNGDWRNPRNDSLWQGLNGTNNICPTGYRLPTEAELTAEGLSSITDAYSKLGFTRAGKRNENPERVENQDDFGSYWSSTIDADESRRIKLDNNSDWTSGSRANGFSVRCIKD